MEKILREYSDYILKEKRYSLKTFRAYNDDVLDFIEFLSQESQVVLSEVGYEIIRMWIVALSERGLSAVSINRKVSALKSFFKFLYQNKYIDVYPLSGHKSLKTEKKLQVPFSENEMHGVIESVEYDDYDLIQRDVIIALFYTLGIRKSELINLKVSDVDFYAKTIRVFGKRSKERMVPLISEMEELLKKYLEFRSGLVSLQSEWLILLKNGNKLNETFVYRLINSYFRGVTSKSKKSPHMLRHTFATHMLNSGVDLNSIKELLGHSSLSSTQIYTQTSLSELKKVYKNAHPRFKKDL